MSPEPATLAVNSCEHCMLLAVMSPDPATFIFSWSVFSPLVNLKSPDPATLTVFKSSDVTRISSLL